MNYQVDLIINCYEKTYERVIKKEFIQKILDQNEFSFKNIFVVINNVKNKELVENIAVKLKKDWFISDFFGVEDYLNKALKECNLIKKDILDLVNYTNRALVCGYIAKSEYFVHRDPDLYLENFTDWITPCIQEMEKNENILIANPLRKWYKDEKKFWFQESNDFYYSYWFSDQLYLAKKNNLLKDIYKYDHIYTSRFPLYPIGKTFEARIDAYMRKKNKIRLVYKKTIYVHQLWKGTPYPKYSMFQYFKRIGMFIIRKIFCKLFYNYTTNKYRKFI